MPTKNQIRRLIRKSDLVDVDGQRHTVGQYNLLGAGPVWLHGDDLTKLSFSMDELLHGTIVDEHTLKVGLHHLVFIKFTKLKIDGKKIGNQKS